MSPHYTKKTKTGLVVASLVFIFISLLQYQNLFQRNEWILYDWFLKQARSEKIAPADVAIILIDDASLQAMDPVVGQWPWPRSIYAEIIDFLALGKPDAVVFDILFTENQRIATRQNHNSDGDQQFIHATQSSGHVFHALQLITDSEDDSNKSLLNKPLPELIQDRDQVYVSGVSRGENNKGPEYNNYLIPIDGLYQAAKGVGVVTATTDRDGILRRAKLFHRYLDHFYPALSVAPVIKSKTNSSAIDNLPLTNNNLLLNYYSSYKSYSMSGILSSMTHLAEGDIENLLVDPLEFKNKTIFIGASAVGLSDLKSTPMSNNVPGVYVHATAFSNIMQGDFLIPPNTISTYTYIILAAFITALGVFLSGKILLQLLIPVVVLTGFISFSYWQYQHNQVVFLLPALLTTLLAWASSFTWLLFTEEKEKTKIRRMFSQYVSPAALSVMVDQFEDYRSAGAGSKETVSILFSDIRGFTTLSEHVEAETVVKILNYYLSSMTSVILKNNGTIDKFIGDAIMAIWGAPVKSETHPADAVIAAIEMFQKLEDVNRWLTQNKLFPVDIGIGINTGDVILGSIGSAQKADYTVIGDNVNLAARLEGITKVYGCKIILSESTFKLIKKEIPCLLVDMVKVKGKNLPIKIFTPVISINDLHTHSRQQLADIENISHTAFDHYMRRDWEQAINIYTQLPPGPLRELHIKRCEDYKHNAPAPDWDGSHTMTSK